MSKMVPGHGPGPLGPVTLSGLCSGCGFSLLLKDPTAPFSSSLGLRLQSFPCSLNHSWLASFSCISPFLQAGRLAHLQGRRGNAASCMATGRKGGQPQPPRAELPEGRGQRTSTEQESPGHLHPVLRRLGASACPAQRKEPDREQAGALSSARVTTNHRECRILMQMPERQDLNPLWRSELQLIGLW